MEFIRKVSGKKLSSIILEKISDALKNTPKKDIKDYYYYKNTCSIINPKDKCIAYAKSFKFLKKSMYNGENCLILVPENFKEDSEFSKYLNKFYNSIFVYVEDPLMKLLDIHDYFHDDKLPQQWFHKVNDMGNGVFVGENVEIGENVIIYPGTIIYDNVQIGNNCIIHANCSIGGDGFRFIRTKDGTLRKMIHISNPGVIIEDDVEIQCNCNVSRGVFDATRIGKGTKLDALVHIAHNDVIGENNVIAAQTCLSGSVEIGKNNWIGAGVVISNGVKVGDNNWLGLAVKVAYDVGNNERISGFYGVDHKKWKRWWKKEFRD